MKTLCISDKLSLPLDSIQLATVVYGARGAGKTSFGRVAAEEATRARQRFCAIDLKGDWYGLKSSVDGKSDGIPVVIFGGEHADVPLEPDAGAFVGETVAKLEQSCILDFELLSKGKQIRFLAGFFEALYHHNREPLLLLLDEAQRYAPQKPGPEETRTLGAVQDLVKLGRKHGIGPVLFTQRGSSLNKEVSELCDLLVAFRTPGPLDQDRIKDWLDANTTKAQRDEVMGKLSSLPTGTAVFASGHPDLTTFGVYPVRRPETFDSSATPKVGERKKEPKRLATPDLDALRAKMADAIERAKADDPRALRARVAELEKDLRREFESKKVVEPTTKVVEVPVFDRKLLDGLHEGVFGQLQALGGLVEGAKSEVGRLMNEYRKACATAAGAGEKGVSRLARPPPGLPVGPRPTGYVPPARVAHRDPKPANGASTGLPKAERQILATLVQHGTLSLTQAAMIAGYSAKSGGMRNAAGALRSLGYIDGGNDAMTATGEGIAALGPVQALPVGPELAEHWYAQLPKAEREILAVCVGAYPRAVALAEAAERCGYSVASGGIRNAAGKLRTLMLVTGGNAGMIANERLVHG